MNKFQSVVTTAIAAATLAGGIAAPAGAQNRWDYGGGRPGERDLALVGVGVRDLLPELRATNRGRAFVLRNFDDNDDGRINRREADAANRAFLGVAGGRRDRFDWDARDVGFRNDEAYRRDEGPRRGDYVGNEWRGEGGYDRRGMRDYRFRQTRYGATFDLADVLFQTASAALRPGATDRLRPLASYLRANPGVRVRVDGHTDSVGSEASNQTLSERRAASVADALGRMGVRAARIRYYGHGETMPAATNATEEGRRLNRRVKVTLVDRQAREFERID